MVKYSCLASSEEQTCFKVFYVGYLKFLSQDLIFICRVNIHFAGSCHNLRAPCCANRFFVLVH